MTEKTNFEPFNIPENLPPVRQLKVAWSLDDKPVKPPWYRRLLYYLGWSQPKNWNEATYFLCVDSAKVLAEEIDRGALSSLLEELDSQQ